MTLASLVAILNANAPLILALAGWLGAKLHTKLSIKKTDAAHQQLNALITAAVTTAVTAAIGPTPNGARSDN